MQEYRETADTQDNSSNLKDLLYETEKPIKVRESYIHNMVESVTKLKYKEQLNIIQESPNKQKVNKQILADQKSTPKNTEPYNQRQRTVQSEFQIRNSTQLKRKQEDFSYILTLLQSQNQSIYQTEKISTEILQNSIINKINNDNNNTQQYEFNGEQQIELIDDDEDVEGQENTKNHIVRIRESTHLEIQKGINDKDYQFQIQESQILKQSQAQISYKLEYLQNKEIKISFIYQKDIILILSVPIYTSMTEKQKQPYIFDMKGQISNKTFLAYDAKSSYYYQMQYKEIENLDDNNHRQTINEYLLVKTLKEIYANRIETLMQQQSATDRQKYNENIIVKQFIMQNTFSQKKTLFIIREMTNINRHFTHTDENQQIYDYVEIAQCYSRLLQPDIAIQYYNRVLQFYKKKKVVCKEEIIALLNTALIYHENNNNEDALKVGDCALLLSEKLDNQNLQSEVQFILGCIFLKLEKCNEAIFQFQQIIRSYQDQDNLYNLDITDIITRTQEKLHIIYNQLERYEDATSILYKRDSQLKSSINILEEHKQYIINKSNHNKQIRKLKLQIANNNFLLGQHYSYNLLKYDQALEYHLSAIKIFNEIYTDKNANILADFYIEVGFVYQQQNNYKQSFQYFQNALKIKAAQNIIDFHSIGLIYNHLGNLNLKFDHLEESNNFYKKCLQVWSKIFQKDQKYQELGEIYQNLGNLHQKYKNYQKSLKYYEQSFTQYHALYPPTHIIFANLYQNIGEVQFKINQNNKAQLILQKALIIFEKHNNNFQQNSNILQIQLLLNQIQPSIKEDQQKQQQSNSQIVLNQISENTNQQ